MSCISEAKGRSFESNRAHQLPKNIKGLAVFPRAGALRGYPNKSIFVEDFDSLLTRAGKRSVPEVRV